MHCVYDFSLHRTFGYLHLGFMPLFFPLLSGTPHHHRRELEFGLGVGGKQYRWGVLREFTWRYGPLKDRIV